MAHHAAFVCAEVGRPVLQAAAPQVEGGLDDWLKKWCTAEVPYPLDRWAGCWETSRGEFSGAGSFCKGIFPGLL